MAVPCCSDKEHRATETKEKDNNVDDGQAERKSKKGAEIQVNQRCFLMRRPSHKACRAVTGNHFLSGMGGEGGETKTERQGKKKVRVGCQGRENERGGVSGKGCQASE